MIEDVIDAIETSIADVKKKFYGVCTAHVINLADPLMLGRVQVQLPSIDALDLQPWARVAVPMAGIMHGHYFIPNMMDEVLVAFEHGDVSAPYILGSLWTAMAPPPLPSPYPQIRAIRTLAGNQLVMTEFPPTVTIQNGPTAPEVLPAPPVPTGPYSSVMLSSAGVTAMGPTVISLQVATSSVIITPTTITLQCGSNVVALGPQGIEIASAGTINITAAGHCSILAPTVSIN
jgi:hypothetical protein